MAVPNDLAARSLQRLARLVEQRRTALGWSKDKAAREAGMTHVTYGRIEQGSSVQANTYKKLEGAFAFRPGACRGVLDGAMSITLTDGTELIEGAQIAHTLTPELEQDVQQAITNVMIGVMPEATGRDIKAIGEQVVELLRKGRAPSELEQ